MKNSDRLPWVVVRWVDSATDHRWVALKEARNLPPYNCLSLGLLVDETPNHVILTPVETLHSEADEYLKMVGDPLSIPRAAIIKMERIEALEGF